MAWEGELEARNKNREHVTHSVHVVDNHKWTARTKTRKYTHVEANHSLNM